MAKAIEVTVPGETIDLRRGPLNELALRMMHATACDVRELVRGRCSRFAKFSYHRPLAKARRLDSCSGQSRHISIVASPSVGTRRNSPKPRQVFGNAGLCVESQ
jgi:hypothetical protein